MQIEKALSIQGWMERPEIIWLAEQASKHKVIAEIGSYMGRSTRALADNTSGIVYAIDDFQGPREIEVANRDLIFDQFLSNMAGFEGRLNVIRANHRELPAIDFRPDMVFIDGAHEYEGVKADIDFWLPRMAPKGLICGHDYQWFEGVRQAVHEVFPNFRVADGTSIWYVELL
jgi:predicted O-methyltransferase YrrM